MKVAMKNKLLIFTLLFFSILYCEDNHNQITIANRSRESLYIYFSKCSPGIRIPEAREQLPFHNAIKRILISPGKKQSIKIPETVRSIFAATKCRHFRRKTKTAKPGYYITTKSFYGSPKFKLLETENPPLR
jgi:hypothetical protein